MSARVRLWLAWTMLALSLIGCPLSLIYTDEPPFILALSWAALAYTSVDMILTALLAKDKQ